MDPTTLICLLVLGPFLLVGLALIFRKKITEWFFACLNTRVIYWFLMGGLYLALAFFFIIFGPFYCVGQVCYKSYKLLSPTPPPATRARVENHLDYDEEEAETMSFDEEEEIIGDPASFEQRTEKFWANNASTKREDNICSICLCDTSYHDGIAKCCGSNFHRECVEQYWNRLGYLVKCPNCRHEEIDV